MLVLTHSCALAEDTRPVQAPLDQFHGQVYGQVYGRGTARIAAPAGNQRTAHAVIENLSPDEIHQRAAQLIGQKSH